MAAYLFSFVLPSITPLPVPVVPEVKISSASAFSSISGSSANSVFLISLNFLLSNRMISVSFSELFAYSSIFSFNSGETNSLSTSPMRIRFWISSVGSILSSGTATFPLIVMPRYAVIQS